MGFEIVVPDSVKGGFYFKSIKHRLAFGIYAHTLQGGQRWLFLIRYKSIRFGFRTHGSSSPDTLTYHDAGWYWPWKKRVCGGRG